ncbi:MAG: response regulator [Hespellia sp.]|nr:response regulator [Hespellia sp.]
MYRVLIVERDVLMQKALETMISKQHSFQVVEKISAGEDVVKVCDDNSIDIVFMGLMLNGMSGIDVSERMHRKHPEIMIYILSPYAKRFYT